MRYCTECGHQNPDNTIICLSCAGRLGSTCPSCGQFVPSGNKFCGQCGARQQAIQEPSVSELHETGALGSLRGLVPSGLTQEVQPAATDIHGERREVTVLFADVADFTATCQVLDSEEVYILIDEAMRLLVGVVHDYEGTVDKFTGDGLMALFGAPTSHENDPERGVHAALDMQTALKPLQEKVKEEHGIDLRVRIGVNTGLVVAGEVGSDSHMEYTVIGDTVNLASRLQTAAKPGRVLVSFSTYQRTRPLFDYRTLPTSALKGFPDPIRVFQPLRVRENPGRVRGLPGAQAPMIGRDQQLAQLQNALMQVQREGESRIVLVTGEAGLGKSRLVAEFRQSLASSDVDVYQGRCNAHTSSKPLQVVADLVRDIIGLPGTAPADAQLNQLRDWLDQSGLADGRLASYLANVLGLTAADSEIAAHLRLLDAQMLQRQTHAALRRVLLSVSGAAPAILIFEDSHWMDPASREFLRYLIQATVDAQLMLMLVSRDSEPETAIRPVIPIEDLDPERLVEIPLRALSEEDGRWLVDQLLRPAAEQDTTVKRRIAERAAGNPFYTEETIRMLLDEGGLVDKDGTWRLTQRAEELLSEVPGTLKGLILTRYDKLPERQRRLLQRAAVLGTRFPVGLLCAVTEEDQRVIEAWLDDLEDRQFLAAEPVEGEPSYQFRHVLIQEAIYETLLKRDRQRIHLEVAQALERGVTWPWEERSNVLGHHYAESSEPEKAIPHLVAAGKDAARRCAFETAAEAYRRVLTLVGDECDDQRTSLQAQVGLAEALKFIGELAEARQILTETVEGMLASRTELGSDLMSVALQGLAELGDVRHRQGAPDAAISYLEQGLDLVQRLHSPDRERMRRSLMDRMAWVRFRQGKLDDALALTGSATLGTDARHADDPTTLASLYNTMGGALLQQGKVDEAIGHVELSLGLYERVGYSWGVANAYTNLGILNFVSGNWADAAEAFEKSHAIRQEIGDMAGLANNLKNLGVLRLAIGDHARALTELESCLAMARRQGDQYGTACVLIDLARLAVVRGRFGEAARRLDQARELTHALGEDEAVQMQWLQATVEAEQGGLKTGIDLAQAALARAREAGLAEGQTDCLRVLGMLHGQAGDYAKAEALLRRSGDLASQRGDPFRRALAGLELGRVYQRLAHPGNPGCAEWSEKARKALQEAVQAFRSLGAKHHLRLAEECLSELPDVADSAVADGAWHPVAVVQVDLEPPSGEDDEALFETISDVQFQLLEIARAHQGQVIRREDGLTIVFGVPEAAEDDPVVGVQAAYRMWRCASDSAGSKGVPLGVRLAVTKGDIVAGERNLEPRTELVLAGEPVQMAERLVQSTPSGRIWVTEAVRNATKHVFVYSRAASTETAGLPAWELVALREQLGAAREVEGLDTSFVGREQHLEVLRDLGQDLDRGTGGLVWIEGEAGIGKTRLMQEFGATMGAEGLLVWDARCTAQRAGQPFWLFADLLTQVFSIRRSDSLEQVRAKINRTMQAWPPDARATRPYLETLLGIPQTDESSSQIANLEPDQLRQQIFVAMRRLIRSLTARQPLVILFDDLHWVDPVSADLLLFLSPLVASSPVLYVCARRSREAGEADDRLARIQKTQASHSRRLVLRRLSTRASERLLAELVADAELPGGVRDIILQRSGGNPYYIREFVRTLIERDHLRRVDGGWELQSDSHIDQLPVPDSLESLIRSRVDSLGAKPARLIRWAAILGRRFEADILESISGLPDAGRLLRELRSREMVQPVDDGGSWQFVHPLLETVIHDSLLRTRRREMHKRVAEVLEDRWAEAREQHAEELAYHFTRAGEGARALPYVVMAGEQAASRYATDEALARFEQARELLRIHGEESETLPFRVMAGLGDACRSAGAYERSETILKEGLAWAEGRDLPPIQRAGLYRRLGETAQKRGKFVASGEYYQRALSILDAPGDEEGQVEVARILTGAAWTHFLQGELQRAREKAGTAVEHARAAGNRTEVARAENVLGGIYYRLGEWMPAMHHTMRAMVLRELMGYSWGVAASLGNLGILAISAGDWPKAEEFFQKSLALREDIGDIEGVAIAYNNLGVLVRDQGKLDEAETCFRESVSAALSIGLAYEVANSTAGLADTLVLQGRIEPAREAVTASLDQAQAIGAQSVAAEAHRVRAKILLAQSARDEAAQAARKSAAIAAEIRIPRLLAAAWRVLAECELQRGNIASAGQVIAKAWEIADHGELNDELERGRIAAQAARVDLACGDVREASENLRIAREIFRRLGADLYLEAVKSNREDEPSAATALSCTLERREAEGCALPV